MTAVCAARTASYTACMQTHELRLGMFFLLVQEALISCLCGCGNVAGRLLHRHPCLHAALDEVQTHTILLTLQQLLLVLQWGAAAGGEAPQDGRPHALKAAKCFRYTTLLYSITFVSIHVLTTFNCKCLIYTKYMYMERGK